MLFAIPRYVLPSPTGILVFAKINVQILAADTVSTGVESAAGFAISIVISLVAAVLVNYIPRTERFFVVVTVGAQSIPVLAIAPFLTSWFGSGIGSKIAASAIVCVFPLIGGWMAGKSSISADERTFAESALPTRWIRLWHFILPRSLPAFVTTLKIACPLCVLGALVGEFVGAQRGLGFRILTGSYYLRTEEMVCGVVLACGLSLLFYAVVAVVERTWLFWHGQRAS